MSTPTEDFHYASVEKLFIPQMVFTGAAMAFAHGSNDVANGIGPMAAVIQIIVTREVSASSAITPFMLFVGSVGIVARSGDLWLQGDGYPGQQDHRADSNPRLLRNRRRAFVTVASSGLGCRCRLPTSQSVR
jgi:hypothetical protein